MTIVDRRQPVGARASFVQQLRLLGWSGRWAYLILGLLLLLVVARTLELDRALGLPRVIVAAMCSLPVPVMWAILVWQGEVPHRRSYHGSLPVSRAGNELARIAAGAVWLVAAYLALAAVGALVAATAGDWARFAAIGPAWITFFAGPLVLYLLVSPLVLWSDSPALRRGVAAFLGVGVVAMILDFEAYSRVMEKIFGDGWGMTTVLLGGFLRLAQVESLSPQQPPATALWLGIALTSTVFAALFRPADLARLVTKRR